MQAFHRDFTQSGHSSDIGTIGPWSSTAAGSKSGQLAWAPGCSGTVHPAEHAPLCHSFPPGPDTTCPRVGSHLNGPFLGLQCLESAHIGVTPTLHGAACSRVPAPCPEGLLLFLSLWKASSEGGGLSSMKGLYCGNDKNTERGNPPSQLYGHVHPDRSAPSPRLGMDCGSLQRLLGKEQSAFPL